MLALVPLSGQACRLKYLVLSTSILSAFLPGCFCPQADQPKHRQGFFRQLGKDGSACGPSFSSHTLDIRNGLVRVVNVDVLVQVCLLPARNGIACPACRLPSRLLRSCWLDRRICYASPFGFSLNFRRLPSNLPLSSLPHEVSSLPPSGPIGPKCPFVPVSEGTSLRCSSVDFWGTVHSI